MPASGLLPNQYLNHINGNEQDKFTELQAKATDANSLSAVMAKVSKSLLNRGSERDTYSVSSSSQGLDQFNNILNMLTLFISGVAAISLFVGGIGVMDIMLVSVTERIREVGLRKAIGAKTKDILMQFLIEAVLLTFYRRNYRGTSRIWRSIAHRSVYKDNTYFKSCSCNCVTFCFDYYRTCIWSISCQEGGGT